MLQVRKLRFCRTSTIFRQCRFLCEIQVLMTVSDFSGCLSGNRFLEGGFTFQWGKGVVFQLGAYSCSSGPKGTHWGASVLIGQGSTIGVLGMPTFIGIHMILEMRTLTCTLIFTCSYLKFSNFF